MGERDARRPSYAGARHPHRALRCSVCCESARGAFGNPTDQGKMHMPNYKHKPWNTMQGKSDSLLAICGCSLLGELSF